MGTNVLSEQYGLQVFLQRCRVRAGISQKTLAQQLYLSPRGYWNLEQGRIRNPSADLLDSLSSILRLGARERWTLYMLAVRHDPPPLNGVALEDASVFSQLLSVQRCPAVIVDPAWQIVASNDAYEDLPFTDASGARRNLMHHILLTPSVRDVLLAMWEEAWAAPLLAELRTACEVLPEAGWPKSLLRHVARDQRLRRAWRRLDAPYLPLSGASRPFRHPVWGPEVTVAETVPRYMTGYKIFSLVPSGSVAREFVAREPAVLGAGLRGDSVEQA
ncbi:MmyB family transcriptional regulator [Streptomyces sp. NPDC002537]